MRRYGWWMLALGLAGVVAMPALAQTAKDSAHARAVKPLNDSIATALRQYCATKGAARYMQPACRSAPKLSAAESSLVASVIAQPPVVVPPTSTPTPCNCGGHPNEPAGYTTLSFTSFDSLPSADFTVSHAGNPSVVVDSTSPEGSKNVGQMLFPAGFPTGIAPGGVYPLPARFASKPRSVYVSFWIKVSANWVAPNKSSNTKILYMRTPTSAGEVGSVEFLGFGFDVTGQLLQPAPILNGIVGVSGTGSTALAVNQVPYDSTAAAKRGVWNHYEILMTLNTPGQYDGSYKWWWNGTLYGDYSSRVRWSDVVGDSFATVYWEPTYGGLGDPVPADQFMRMKNFYISGK